MKRIALGTAVFLALAAPAQAQTMTCECSVIMRASIHARCWSTTLSCIMLRLRNDVPHMPACAVNPWIREPVIDLMPRQIHFARR
jgi:hypothetical protein